MLFNSVAFLIFFPLVTWAYFVWPHRFRWALLLTASCVFYMYFIPKYIVILAFTIVVDYWAGIAIEGSSGRARRLYLWCSIIANVGVLAFFKYFDFLSANVQALAHFLGWNYSMQALQIILPVGLSFHTFQAMSYTIEVYRGKQAAERHFGIYALYVMFYPQLVAGPIERPQNLLHQFRERHDFDYDRVVSGLRLMAWGLFKKIVIADRLAPLVDNIYDYPHEYRGLVFVFATIGFAFQIYCDFSGYSDVALGAARVMGFRLMTNFDRPYCARSVSEFWRRWHISLSTWFRDYLYIPLGGNRVRVARWHFNLILVFLVSGLWHGASWKYVVWGSLHGLYLVFGTMTVRIRDRAASFVGLAALPRLRSALQVLCVFSLVCIAWVFFRANTFSDALYVLRQMLLVAPADIAATVLGHPVNLYVSNMRLLSAGLLIAFLEVAQTAQARGHFATLRGQPAWLRWGFYYALVYGAIFLTPQSARQFIYFQF